MTFDELTEFKKDLKNLLKIYGTLNDDLDIVKLVLEVTPDERPPFSYCIDNLGLETCTIKVKRIARIKGEFDTAIEVVNASVSIKQSAISRVAISCSYGHWIVIISAKPLIPQTEVDIV
jgi:hypothetical protein